MRRLGLRSVLAFAICAFALTACGGGTTGQETAPEDDTEAGQALKVIHYVSGNLGDKSFFDSAERGLSKSGMVYGFETSTLVGGKDSAAWEPDLDKLSSSGNYDIIVVGTYPLTETVQRLAHRYPQQRFIFYDGSVADSPNVYSMLYSQSEGSFLAGAFAAMVTTDPSFAGANPDKVIGFIGGLNDDLINDFKSGYEQGAAYIDPGVKVVADYVGNFADENRAKELANGQYRDGGADIIYNVAGGAGLGILAAGSEEGKYTIGVDSNQNPLYPGSVLTSMLKNVDESVFRALSLVRGGKLAYGKTEILGVKEGAVGIARDQHYEKYVPEAIREKMKDIEVGIASNKIEVQSSLTKVQP